MWQLRGQVRDDAAADQDWGRRREERLPPLLPPHQVCCPTHWHQSLCPKLCLGRPYLNLEPAPEEMMRILPTFLTEEVLGLKLGLLYAKYALCHCIPAHSE